MSCNYMEGQFIYGDNMPLHDFYLDERWQHIDTMPGYMISDYGRVWSEKSQNFLKPKPLDNHGHLGVCLYVQGERRYEYIHRLVAKAFIPNPKHYPIVRHLNDIPSDNTLENLDWGTPHDNALDCIRNGRNHTVTYYERESGLAKIRKPIIAINLNTGDTLEFSCQRQASIILGIQQSNIWKALNGERARAGVYRFEYMKGGHSDGHY